MPKRGVKKAKPPPEKCRECGSDALLDIGTAFVMAGKKKDLKNWYKVWKCLKCNITFKQWLGVK